MTLKQKILLAAAMLTIAGSSAWLTSLDALEPPKCRLCESTWTSDCGDSITTAHMDLTGTNKWKVGTNVHSWGCKDCPTAHPTGDDCLDAMAGIEEATEQGIDMATLAGTSPELIAYVPGDDAAALLCKGQVIGHIPVDAETAARAAARGGELPPFQAHMSDTRRAATP